MGIKIHSLNLLRILIWHQGFTNLLQLGLGCTAFRPICLDSGSFLALRKALRIRIERAQFLFKGQKLILDPETPYHIYAKFY